MMDQYIFIVLGVSKNINILKKIILKLKILHLHINMFYVQIITIYYIYDNTPKIFHSLKEYRITNIECGNEHFYILTDNSLHFIFGSNHFNECFKESGVNNVNIWQPFLINDIVSAKTGGKYIKDVYLGHSCTVLLLKDT